MKPNSAIKLSDIAEINPPRHQLGLDDDDFVSFIPMSDVTDSARWVNRQSRALREVRQGYTAFRDGDVLFAKITPCMENGKGCMVEGLVNGVGFGSTEFHVLRARPNGHPGFVFQWTTAPELRLKAAAQMTGSAGQQRVPATFLEQFQIPYVSYEEQAAIAEILTTVDQAIEQTEALIAKQRRIKAGLLHDLLTRGIDEHGNLRDPTTHRFKESPVGLVPEEWEVVKLGAVVDRLGGVIQTGPFGSQLHADEYTPEGIPFIMPQDIAADGTLLLDSAARIPEHRAVDLRRHIVRVNDVLFARRGDLSRCAAISEDGMAVCGSGCMLVRLSPTAILGEWLAHVYRHDMSQRQILARAVGSTMVNLNSSLLRYLVVVLPDIHEQKRILTPINRFRIQDTMIASLLNKLHLLKTGLMQDLLTGRVLTS